MDAYEKLFYRLDELLKGKAYPLEEFEREVKDGYPGIDAKDVARRWGAIISKINGGYWICKNWRQKQMLIADIKSMNVAMGLIARHEDKRIPVLEVLMEIRGLQWETYKLNRIQMSNAFEELGYYIASKDPDAIAVLEYVGPRANMTDRLKVADEYDVLGSAISLEMLRDFMLNLNLMDYEAGIEIAKIRAANKKGI